MIYKYTTIILMTLSFFYGAAWVFNYIHPWAGIVLAIFGLAFIIDTIFKKTK